MLQFAVVAKKAKSVYSAVFTTGTLSEYLRYIAWINAITAGSDIINSFLILIKPARSSFIRGFYRPG